MSKSFDFLVKPDALYAEYDALREAAPVHEIEASGGRRFALHRYDDVRAALKDARFGAARAPKPLMQAMRWGGLRDMAEVVESGVLVALDPPDHTRLRRVVDPFFRPSAIMRLRQIIEAEAERLLRRLPHSGNFDLIADFASPLPTMVITRLFGFPAEDRVRLKSWSDDLAPLIDTDLQHASLMRGVTAFRQFRRHVDAFIEARRQDPKDDLLGAIAHARFITGELTDAETFGTCAFVLAAGHETTAHVIGTGMLALLTHPKELERLRAQPDLIEPAIEEMLRFESPIQRTGRVLREEITIGQQRVPRGASMRLVIGAANRDPRRFTSPERFDVARPDNRHLAFAIGPHHCLGAGLARLELQIAFAALLRRFPSLALTGEPLHWLRGNKLRGLERLNLTTIA